MAPTRSSETHPNPPQNPSVETLLATNGSKKNPMLPANPSLENLTNSVQNLALTKNSVSRTGSNLDPQLLYGSSSKTQQDQYSGFKNSIPAPSLLYSPTSVLPGNHLNATGNYSGYNLQPEAETATFMNGYGYGYGCNPYQEANYFGDCGMVSPQGDVNYNGLFAQSWNGLQNQDYSDVKLGYELISLAHDREGSKKLQEILLLKDPYNTSLVLKWVTSLSSNGTPFILYLMDHEFGCKVYAKLVDSCNEEQLAVIVNSVTRKKELFLRLSLNNGGSSSIKKLVKALKRSDFVGPVVKCLSFSFSEIMTNRTGSYVISECMEQLDATRSRPLSIQAVNLCLKLATDQEGCISLNRIIDSIRGEDRIDLLEKISCNAVFLSYDPAGNYVVQKVLDLQDPRCTEIICDKLKGNYLNLSSLVGGSHVVEKCLKSDLHWYYCVKEMANNPKKLLQIARDKVGNYVVQTALKFSKQRQSPYHQRLLTALRQNLNDLQFSFGRNVYSLVASEGGVPEV